MSASANVTNHLRIAGRIVELSALRHTPAGIPVVQFSIEHESEQDEAGTKRTVRAEIPAVAFQAQARLIAGAQPGKEVNLEGFLGAKSRRSKKNVLHVTNIEFVEGK